MGRPSPSRERLPATRRETSLEACGKHYDLATSLCDRSAWVEPEKHLRLARLFRSAINVDNDVFSSTYAAPWLAVEPTGPRGRLSCESAAPSSELSSRSRTSNGARSRDALRPVSEGAGIAASVLAVGLLSSLCARRPPQEGAARPDRRRHGCVQPPRPRSGARAPGGGRGHRDAPAVGRHVPEVPVGAEGDETLARSGGVGLHPRCEERAVSTCRARTPWRYRMASTRAGMLAGMLAGLLIRTPSRRTRTSTRYPHRRESIRMSRPRVRTGMRSRDLHPPPGCTDPTSRGSRDSCRSPRRSTRCRC